MLRVPDGPRIAALEFGGWDTHTGQNNRMVQLTEFGRTARMNGTNGTDHGTATVAFVAGGAVVGGRVLAKWPGLGPGQLFEDRDLAETTDIRSVAQGILAGHLGLSQAAPNALFPGGEPAQSLRGLVRAA
jgi:uncharacterized protein (DUF1501 family)